MMSFWSWFNDLFVLPLNNESRLSLIIISFIVNWLLFACCPVPPQWGSESVHPRKAGQLVVDVDVDVDVAVAEYRRRLLVRNYLLSTLHAVIGIIIVPTLWLTKGVPIGDMNRMYFGLDNTEGDQIMYYGVTYSCGYFLFDLSSMVLFPSLVSSWSQYVHHLVIAAGFTASIFTGICAPFHFLLLFEELSTPSLNFKTLLRHRPELSDFFSYSFALLFALGRLVFGSFVFYHGLSNFSSFLSFCLERHDYVTAFNGSMQISAGLITRALNVYWAKLIANKVFAASKKSRKNV